MSKCKVGELANLTRRKPQEEQKSVGTWTGVWRWRGVEEAKPHWGGSVGVGRWGTPVRVRGWGCNCVGLTVSFSKAGPPS
jgi:hypothetical protein